MILHDFFGDYDSHDAMYARDRFEECILIFVSDTEKENFKDYAASKWSKDRIIWMVYDYHIWNCRVHIGKIHLKRNTRMHLY